MFIYDSGLLANFQPDVLNLHLSLYVGVYRTLKSESERNTLNYSQSDHDFA